MAKNSTKQNKTKQNKTKQNKTKQKHKTTHNNTTQHIFIKLNRTKDVEGLKYHRERQVRVWYVVHAIMHARSWSVK